MTKRQMQAFVMLMAIPVLMAATDASVAGSIQPAWNYYLFGLDGVGELAYDLASIGVCLTFGAGAPACEVAWVL